MENNNLRIQNETNVVQSSQQPDPIYRNPQPRKEKAE